MSTWPPTSDPLREPLLHRATAVEEAVRINAESLIESVEDAIRIKDGEGDSELVFALPTQFQMDGGVTSTSDNLRVVVWGKLLEHLEQKNEGFELRIVPNARDGPVLVVKWKRAIDQAIVDQYSSVISRYTS